MNFGRRAVRRWQFFVWTRPRTNCLHVEAMNTHRIVGLTVSRPWWMMTQLTTMLQTRCKESQTLEYFATVVRSGSPVTRQTKTAETAHFWSLIPCIFHFLCFSVTLYKALPFHVQARCQWSSLTRKQLAILPICLIWWVKNCLSYKATRESQMQIVTNESVHTATGKQHQMICCKVARPRSGAPIHRGGPHPQWWQEWHRQRRPQGHSFWKLRFCRAAKKGGSNLLGGCSGQWSGRCGAVRRNKRLLRLLFTAVHSFQQAFLLSMLRRWEKWKEMRTETQNILGLKLRQKNLNFKNQITQRCLSSDTPTPLPTRDVCFSLRNTQYWAIFNFEKKATTHWSCVPEVPLHS